MYDERRVTTENLKQCQRRQANHLSDISTLPFATVTLCFTKTNLRVSTTKLDSDSQDRHYLNDFTTTICPAYGTYTSSVRDIYIYRAASICPANGTIVAPDFPKKQFDTSLAIACIYG